MTAWRTLTPRERLAATCLVGLARLVVSDDTTGTEVAEAELVIGNVPEDRRAIVLALAAAGFLGPGKRDQCCALWLRERGADLTLAKTFRPSSARNDQLQRLADQARSGRRLGLAPGVVVSR